MQKGAIEITGYITPTSETDTYPTHIDVYGKGGYRVVDTLESRDSISSERRTEGMLVYVTSTNKIYHLVGGITNDKWKDFASLPPLGTFTVAGISYPEIYVGTESGVPVTSQSFGYALIDILALNTRFLTGNFIMADALFQPSYPGAQFISNLPDGVLAKTGKILRGAEGGIDYVDIVDRNLAIENCISTWLTSNNKTLRNTRVKIIDGTPQDGDDVQGIRTLISNALISRGAITSDDSVFGLNNLGGRELKIYDRQNGAGRLTKSLNLITDYSLTDNVNYKLVGTISTEGQVLADMGSEIIEDGRVFRKLGFTDIASNAATYILKTANQSLPNAQALDTLGVGLLKVNNGGTLTLATVNVDYVNPTALEEETAARVEADGALEASIATVAAETQAQITAITGYGSLALLTEFLANLGWTSGYSEYLWSKYRPLRTYNTYGDTDNYSKDGGNIWYDANHIGAAGAFKPGLRITSWDSSNIFASDLFPVSMGLFGYRNGLGYVSAQEGFVWQSYFDNNSSSGHYRFPVNFGLYYVGHNEGGIGWDRKEIILMNYIYADNRFYFEKDVTLKGSLSITSLNSGILKVTNGIVSLAVADVDYATQALLEQIKLETEGYRDETLNFKNLTWGYLLSAEASADQAMVYRDAASSYKDEAQNSANLSFNYSISASQSATNAEQSKIAAAGQANLASIYASSAETSKNAAITAQLNAESSANAADEDATSAYMSYQQVLNLVNNILSNQMTYSYANIEVGTSLDPNNPMPKLQNFKSWYPADSTNTDPKTGTRYSIVDSAFPHTDNYSRYWEIIGAFGTESSIDSSFNFNFYHKLLTNPITPFQIHVNSTGSTFIFDGIINMQSKAIKNVLDPVDDQDVTTKSWVINLFNTLDIELTGDVTGVFENGIINTTLQSILHTKISDFDIAVTDVAKLISLDLFAVPANNIDMNGKKIVNAGAPNELVDSDVATVGFVKSRLVTDIELTGSVTGTINLETGIIPTSFNSIQNLSDLFLTYNWPDLGSYGQPYIVSNIFPNAEPSPIYTIQSQVGSMGANSFRRWTTQFKHGSSASVDSEYSLSFYHSLQSGDHIITPFRIVNNAWGLKTYIKSTLDMYNNPIVGVPTPLVSDGASNKEYVDTKTWLSTSITDFTNAAIIAAKTVKLNEFALPINNIDFNNFKGINVADPVNGGDIVNKSFLLTTIAAGLPLVLTGSIYGSGVGTVNTTFNTIQNITSPTNGVTWNYNYQVGDISNLSITNQKIILDDVTPSIKYIDRVSRRSATDNSFQVVNWLDSITSGSTSQIVEYQFVNGNNGITITPIAITKPSSNIPTVSFNAIIDGIPTPTNNNHPTNKSYVDNKTYTSSSITDFATAAQSTVKNNVRLNDFVNAPNSSVSMGNQKLTNLLPGVNSTDAATVGQIGLGGNSWIEYTPTITCPSGSPWVNPTLPSAANYEFKCFYTIIGKTMIINFNLRLGAVGTKGNGLYLFSIPSGYLIDESVYGYDTSIVSRNASINGGLTTDGYLSMLYQTQVGRGVVRQGSAYSAELLVSPVYAQGQNKLCLFGTFLVTTNQGFLVRNAYVNSDFFMFVGDIPGVYKFNATIKIQ